MGSKMCIFLQNIYFLCYYLLQLMSIGMSYNVPTVYDGLPTRIRALRNKTGLAKSGGVLAWEWSEATDIGEWRRSVNSPLCEVAPYTIFL
jgi:hypothetical protein